MFTLIGRELPMRLYRCLLSLLLGLALAGPVAAAGLDNRLWNELLSRHVRVLEGGHASQVDYTGMAPSVSSCAPTWARWRRCARRRLRAGVRTSSWPC